MAGSIADPRTVNRYAYVGNDPVNFVDPTGRWPDWSSVGKRFVKAVTCPVAGAGGSAALGAGLTSGNVALVALGEIGLTYYVSARLKA